MNSILKFVMLGLTAAPTIVLANDVQINSVADFYQFAGLNQKRTISEAVGTTAKVEVECSVSKMNMKTKGSWVSLVNKKDIYPIELGSSNDKKATAVFDKTYNFDGHSLKFSGSVTSMDMSPLGIQISAGSVTQFTEPNKNSFTSIGTDSLRLDSNEPLYTRALNLGENSIRTITKADGSQDIIYRFGCLVHLIGKQ